MNGVNLYSKVIKKGVIEISAYNKNPKAKLLGSIRLNDYKQPGAYISHFFVKKKHRNNGIGNILMQEAIRTAISLKCGALSLHVYIDNKKAIRFYKRIDFFIVYTTTRKNKTYFMVKKL